ncbi:MAG: hydantoinase B/oxoprolinase family protein, partial [Desulfuromonas sp.]|nr:hydantoinase B/oxoprolinase family protein [Desulfuromonas sp.]
MLNPKIKFSIDRGGTFTDVYAEFTDGRSTVLKLLSDDPANYPDAPREGIRRILEQELGAPLAAEQISAENIDSIRMGTTVATNALLERKGAATLLLISRGLGDLLQIGDQTRPELFALNIQRPEQLYQRVIEVDERIRPAQDDEIPCRTGRDGRGYRILNAPDRVAMLAQLHDAHQHGCRSVAVVLAHAYACPEHEMLLAELADQAGFEHVSLSHQVMPTIRMVPRGDTTVVDAYLTPHIQQYVAGFSKGFRDRLQDTELLFMASDGGLVSADTFNGSRALLSGPAGGVVGYAQTCRRVLPQMPVIGFDMGGTSTDVSRYDGRCGGRGGGHYDLVQQTEVAGVRIQAPQLNIHTVAAGGGSRLFFHHGMFVVGPESAGSHPGPVCYRKQGYLTVTDANLMLGRLQADFFPHIFGPDENQPLDIVATRRAFVELTADINRWLEDNGRPAMTLEEVAAGFVDVANEQMARPIRAVSVQRGFDLAEHALACFGGAGGQHACDMARKLRIETIFIHRYAGILSAYGMGLAEQVQDRQQAVSGVLTDELLASLRQRQQQLAIEARAELARQGVDVEHTQCEEYLNLRYAGTDHGLMIARPAHGDYRRAFVENYRREYGFELDAVIEVDDVRVRVSSCAVAEHAVEGGALDQEQDHGQIGPRTIVPCYLSGQWRQTPVYHCDDVRGALQIVGPALIIQQTATLVVELDCVARFTADGDLVIDVAAHGQQHSCQLDPVQLALYGNRFMSIAEQMGHTLQRTAISTNIKERCDFSCALFDGRGALIANAPHTPVHLGAMGEAVCKQIAAFSDDLQPGDVLLSNHPQLGGSHLPDMTVISPVWHQQRIVMYVANRGHHADIGGLTPGSMPPFSTSLEEEGCAIRGMKLVRQGRFQQQEIEALLSETKHDADGRIIPGSCRLADNISDFKAQVAANQCGSVLLQELIAGAGLASVEAYMGHIQDHAERSVRDGLLQLAQAQGGGDGQRTLRAEDRL